jgi:transcriptional regulator with XRE-family HTH domain
MDEFSTRLRELLEYLNITPVILAEKMGVQRTSFNHLLSGRNKPGFEFLHRLHSCYPSINLNWLIAGTGSITESDDHKISHIEKYESESQSGIDLFTNIFNPRQTQNEVKMPAPDSEIQEELSPESKTNMNPKPSVCSTDEEIQRLIIVYKDGRMVEVKP